MAFCACNFAPKMEELMSLAGRFTNVGHVMFRRFTERLATMCMSSVLLGFPVTFLVRQAFLASDFFNF